MLAHQLRELKHGDLLFPSKHRLQLGVRIDQTLIPAVLQAIGFDVVPKFFGDLGARYRLFADDGGQLRTRPYGLHQPLIPRTPPTSLGLLARGLLGCRSFRGTLSRCRHDHPPLMQSPAALMVPHMRYGLRVWPFL